MPTFIIQPLSDDDVKAASAFYHPRIVPASFDTILYTPAFVAGEILPFLSSTAGTRQTHHNFKLMRVKTPVPGALVVISSDSELYHLYCRSLPLADTRMMQVTVAAVHHPTPSTHNTLQATIRILNTRFALLPPTYIARILSSCPSCAPIPNPPKPSLPPLTVTTPLHDITNLRPAFSLPNPDISTPSSASNTNVIQLLNAKRKYVSPSSFTQSQLPSDPITLPTAKRPRISSPPGSPPPSVSHKTRRTCTTKPIFDTRLSGKRFDRGIPPSFDSRRHCRPAPSSSSSKRPGPSKESPLERAGVTDEIADMFAEGGAYETHEEFLLLMHSAYEMAGLPADRLLGKRESLEEAAEYYD